MTDGAVPPAWRELVAFVNGRPTWESTRGHGEECEGWTYGAGGNGDCDTDGHYRCNECVNVSQRELRRRRSQCVECGAPLVFGPRVLCYSAREPDCCPICNANDLPLGYERAAGRLAR